MIASKAHGTATIHLENEETMLIADAILSHHNKIKEIIKALPQFAKDKQTHTTDENERVLALCEKIYEAMVDLAKKDTVERIEIKTAHVPKL